MNPKIITTLLVIVGVVMAVSASTAIADGDMLYVAAVVFGVVSILAVTVMRTLMPVIAVGCILFGQRGPLLLGFGYWEIVGGLASVALIIEFIIRGPTIPYPIKKLTLLSIACAYVIIPLHLVASKLGFGYGTAGGLRVSILVISILVFVWLLHNTASWQREMHLAPWISLIPSAYLALSDVVTFAMPSTIGIFQMIYPVNTDAITMSSTDLFRFRGMGTAGVAIITVTASVFIAAKRNEKAAKLLFLLSIPICIVMVALSAFRSHLLTCAIIITIALFLRSRKLLIVGAALALGALTFLSAMQSSAIVIPDNVQRVVSWFPGDWDISVRVDTSGSTDFRYRLWSKWYDDFFGDIWLFGRGQQAEDSGSDSVAALLRQLPYSVSHSSYLGELQIQSMIDSQNMHSGILAIIDYSGVLGLLFIAIASLRALANAIFLVRHYRLLHTWEIWITLTAVCFQPRFWLTGLYSIDLPYIAVSYVLVEITRARVTAELAAEPTEDDVAPESLEAGLASR